MGKAKGKEMLFWTKEEYLKFSEVMKDKPISYYAFEVLYWTGIREGELLALERGDFNISDRKLTINKSYQHLQGEDYITSPKTEKSNRVIELPEFLCREMEDYFGMLYKCDENTRLFTFSKSYLHHEMDRGAKAAGVKRIRIHDLRHSHVAHCIELGFSPVAIGNVKTFDAIRKKLLVIDEHLQAVQKSEELDLEILESLRMILEMLVGLEREDEVNE